MRPAWNGRLSFGLISIPIALYSAVEASERVAFHLYHRKDRAPIRYKKFCSREDIEVPADEIVRGYELNDEEFALVEKEDLEKVQQAQEDGASEGEMEVLQFIDLASLDPVSLDHPYLAAPRKGGEKAFGVLRDALADTHRIGIARFHMRKRARLAAVIPGARAIAIESLRPFEELRNPDDLQIPAVPKRPAEVKMAKLLIEQMSTEPWNPAEHPDTYRKALEKLLASRRRFSLETKRGAARSEAEGTVVDLMEALRKSLGKTHSRPARKSARRAGAA